MASFVGTKEEFKRYIGPMLRNLVQQLTKKRKKEVGRCEHCQTTENLEAAHIHGKDRGALIDKILNKYTTNSMVTIDLADFEQHFRNEHHEIDKTILILCRTCHKNYDTQTPPENPPQPPEPKPLAPPPSPTEGRIFTNKEIQSQISKVAKNLPARELEVLCKLEPSKDIFKLNFPLFIRVSKNITPVLKLEAVKDSSGINRWTWRYEFEKENYIYAITTQWYEKNDLPVKQWLHKMKANKALQGTAKPEKRGR